MPIPLKPAGPDDARGYGTGIGGRFAPRDTYSLAFQVISSASVLDAWRQELFVGLLGGKDSVGAAAYLAIVTRAPKIAAIKAAAKSALPKHAYTRFEGILKAADSLEAYRDKLAHWQEHHVPRVPNELCLRDPSAPRLPDKAPALGLFIFSKDEMKRYINYAVEVSSAQREFHRIFEEGPPWPEAKFAKLDQQLEALAKARQRL